MVYIFDIINENYLESDYGRFKKNYLIEKDDQSLIGTKQLFNKTKHFILSRTKKDVLKDLPKKNQITKTELITDSQKKCYQKILNDKNLDPLVKFTKLLQVTSHPKLYDKNYNKIEDCSKLILLEKVLRSNLNTKVIIFFRYIDIIEDIKSIAAKINYKINYIYGQTPKNERNDIIDNFNSNNDKQILLLSYKTSALGLNINTADAVIHYDRWWNPALEKQAEDRAYRFGRKNLCLFINL